jgi:hypothetical protein
MRVDYLINANFKTEFLPSGPSLKSNPYTACKPTSQYLSAYANLDYFRLPDKRSLTSQYGMKTLVLTQDHLYLPSLSSRIYGVLGCRDG